MCKPPHQPFRMSQIITCVIFSEWKSKLRPTHIIPVTIVFCEVDLKPTKKIKLLRVSSLEMSNIHLAKQLFLKVVLNVPAPGFG